MSLLSLLRRVPPFVDKHNLSHPTNDFFDGALPVAAPFWFQVVTVTKRSLLALWRSPDYIFTRLFVHVFVALFSSLTLLQLGNSVRDLQYRVSTKPHSIIHSNAFVDLRRLHGYFPTSNYHGTNISDLHPQPMYAPPMDVPYIQLILFVWQ